MDDKYVKISVTTEGDNYKVHASGNPTAQLAAIMILVSNVAENTGTTPVLVLKQMVRVAQVMELMHRKVEDYEIKN